MFNNKLISNFLISYVLVPLFIACNVPGIFRWFSTSLPSTPDIMVINSTPNDINFVDGKAILLLPSDVKRFYSTSSITNNKDSVEIQQEDKLKDELIFMNNDSILIKNDHFKLLSSKDTSLFVYSNIRDILVNNPVNNNTQILIEKFLVDQFEKLLNENYIDGKQKNLNVLGVDISRFNGTFKKYCLDKSYDIKKSLNNLRNMLNEDNNLKKDLKDIKTKFNIFNYYFKLIINNISDEKFMSCLFYSVFKVVSFNGMVPVNSKNTSNIRSDVISALNLNIYMGKYITNVYFKKIYDKYLETNSIINNNEKEYEQEINSLRDFKLSYLEKEKNSVLKDDEFFLHIGSKLLEILLVSDILSIKVFKIDKEKTQSILVCNKEMSKLLERKNPVSILPDNLPMIVKPKPYDEKKLIGGYLLNGDSYETHIFPDKIGYGIPSEIEEKSVLLPVINNMMNTPFKVNIVLLKYLIEKNYIHNLLISPNHVHELEEKEKRNKYEEREFQSYLSKKLLQQNILMIADIYSNVPAFYFPIKLDHRGRLYPLVSYFNYQSTELAKALILFSRPDCIKRTEYEEIDYLKAYGASCYGNSLNKKSYNKRVEWVNSNWSEIIDYENSNLVKNAEEKFLFLAFCIEMKRFDDFLNNEKADEFKTYLPVQLDCTCNGFQHLALLSNETSLYEPLNLSKSNKNEDPRDFYSHILDNLNVYLESECKIFKEKMNDLSFELNKKLTNEKKKEIQKKLEVTKAKLEAYKRLLVVGLSRKEIKASIMNKPYNAKNRTLSEYIKESLVLSHKEQIEILDKKGELKIIDKGWYKVNGNESNNSICSDDIELLVECIENIIYVKYPNILLLTNYFKDMARILNKLNLPIIWRLPTGLKVSQKYMKKRSLKIEPFTFIDKSITLTITDKINIDKNKQVLALMPNLVHSLDSAALILLYNSFYNSVNQDNNINFYSVHDCYGVTAKYVGKLINNLRAVYLSLYSSKRYIEKFDEDIIMSIVQSYGESNCTFDKDKRIIHIKDNNDIKLPEIASFLQKINRDLTYERLSKSIYFIT